MSARLPAAPTASFPYRILAKVGEGAMGEVFRAEDRDLHRQVAIKVVKLGHAAAEDALATQQRFLQEARAAAAIAHPNVPTLYRVGVEAGWPYLVMEWCEGATLEAMLAQGWRFTAEQAARMGGEVLGALAAAHAAGVVHRDIKPANLIVAPDGHVKVTDFGIARVRGESSLAHTQAGLLLGTPWYAAPEQLAGAAIDGRADLYGVGCVLFEMVTGAPPYTVESVYELWSAIQSADPPAPSARAAAVPPAFDVIVQRALAVDPADRFASADDMAAALAQLMGRPAAAPRSRPPRRGSSPADRQAPTVVASGRSAAELVASVVREWPATALGRLPTARFLAELVERPLHARPFEGAVALAQGWLLVSDGLIYAAFDPTGGLTGDALLAALPDHVDATLHALPAGLDARVVPGLASIIHPPRTRLAGLDSAYADLGGVADRLGAEGFDGALHLTRAGAHGYVLFRAGRRVLAAFGDGWPPDAATRPWEAWIADAAAGASVEELVVSLPALTFRQQLRGVALDVVRPPDTAASSLRSDAAAAARGLALRPRAESRASLRRGETALQTLIDADPASALARWLLAELGLQFAQYGRAARWPGLVAPLDEVTAVKLHHGPGELAPFDVTTFDASDRCRHVADRVARGDAAAVRAFVARAVAAKAALPELGAAVLVAPSFDEEALAAYLAALAAGRSRLGLDAFRHREGHVRVGRGGLHLLLIEEDGARRRPLVTE